VTLTDILFLPDLNGKTPLHYSIKTNNTRVTDRLVKALAYTDFDHHNRFIIDIYAKLIELVPQ
jgi:ankyrin repeat protein